MTTQIYPNQSVSVAAFFQDQGAGLGYAFFTFETYPSPSYSCKVGVQLGSPVSTSNIYLHDDNGYSLGPMWLGSGQQESNSKCTLNTTGSNVTLSGGQYAVTINVVFKDPFNGPKYTWLNGYDNNGAATGWIYGNAAFIIPTQDYAPLPLSVFPASGTNQPGEIQQFAYSTTDANGAFTMYHTELVFNQGSTWIPGYNPSRRCKIIQDSAFISLENDSQNGYVNGGYTPFGSSQPISNSQCTIYPLLSNGVATGLQSQTISFGVAFASGFQGVIQSHIFAADNLGLSSWDSQQNGTWLWNGSYNGMPGLHNATIKPTSRNAVPTEGGCSGGGAISYLYNNSSPTTFTQTECSGNVNLNNFDYCVSDDPNISTSGLFNKSATSFDVTLTAGPNTSIGAHLVFCVSNYYFAYVANLVNVKPFYSSDNPLSLYKSISSLTGASPAGVRQTFIDAGLLNDANQPITIDNYHLDGLGNAAVVNEQEFTDIIGLGGFKPNQLLAPPVNPGVKALEAALGRVATGSVAALSGLVFLTGVILQGAIAPPWAGGPDEICYQQYVSDITTCQQRFSPSSSKREACYGHAMTRFSLCRRGLPAPPLQPLN